MPAPYVRFDLAPVIEYLAKRTSRDHLRYTDDTTELVPDGVIAAWAGLPVRTVLKYRHDGIPMPAAERLAEALREHPTRFWADWFSHIDDRGRLMRVA